ncbi:MAG TPA: protein phosphatase 2C domain-containing protein, partial [Sedimentisphaerales bacterium]
MSSAYYESAEASDVGKKRKNNEDACLRLPDRGVYCVADGMGGQAGGDLASAAIITSLQQVFDKAAPEDDATFSRRIALFKKGTNQASKWIKSFSDEKVIGQMGSTVVALVIDPRNPARAVSLHAGDSRMYLFRKGELKQVTADHSAVAVLAAKLGRSPESIPAKFQNDLLRAVGLSESVELEKNSMLVVSGDLFLICTDGLTKMQSDQQIAKILNDGLKISLADVAQNLIKAANEAGGKDNVTAILIKAGDLINAPCEIDLEEEEEEEDKTLPTPTVSLPANENPHPDGADVQDDTPVTENITREKLSSERPATTTSAAATIQNSAAQNVSAKTNSGSEIELRQPSERKRNFSPSRFIFAAIKATKAAIRSKPTAGVPNPPAAKPVSAPMETSGPSFALD